MMPLWTTWLCGEAVRMGVGFGRLAVGGPAGVADGRHWSRGAVVTHLGDQMVEFADGFEATQCARLQYGEARRIIAAIFQLAQSREHDRGGFLRADVADDSTHFKILGSILETAAMILGRKIDSQRLNTKQRFFSCIAGEPYMNP
ncbi:MAG: hypothetical protein MZV65_32750 [Chromatiales bacterium]|nr:hypothetical protein [Chromatiales bacterium]